MKRTTNTRYEIHRKAAVVFGMTESLRKIAEELEEMHRAIGYYLGDQSERNLRSLIDEAADIEVCSEKLRALMPECADEIDAVKELKYTRLRRLIDIGQAMENTRLAIEGGTPVPAYLLQQKKETTENETQQPTNNHRDSDQDLPGVRKTDRAGEAAQGAVPLSVMPDEPGQQTLGKGRPVQQEKARPVKDKDTCIYYVEASGNCRQKRARCRFIDKPSWSCTVGGKPEKFRGGKKK